MGNKPQYVFDNFEDAVAEIKRRPAANKIGSVEYRPFTTGKRGRYGVHMAPVGMYNFAMTGDVCNHPSGSDADSAAYYRNDPEAMNPGDAFTTGIVYVQMKNIDKIPQGDIMQAARRGNATAIDAYANIKFATAPVDSRVYI